jgi:hypothetical protein
VPGPADLYHDNVSDVEHREARARAFDFVDLTLEQWIANGLPARSLAEQFLGKGAAVLLALDGPEETSRLLHRYADTVARGEMKPAGNA